MENKDKISNPNKVSPGLVVVIPAPEKYGIDKNSEESVQKAKELAEKIKSAVEKADRLRFDFVNKIVAKVETKKIKTNKRGYDSYSL